MTKMSDGGTRPRVKCGELPLGTGIPARIEPGKGMGTVSPTSKRAYTMTPGRSWRPGMSEKKAMRHKPSLKEE